MLVVVEMLLLVVEIVGRVVEILVVVIVQGYDFCSEIGCGHVHVTFTIYVIFIRL